MSANYLKYYGEEPVTAEKTRTEQFVVRTPEEIAQAIIMHLRAQAALSKSNK